MSRRPYMKFYVGDWLSDPKVRRLTWEQKGVYIDMLALMWKNGGDAGLPNDPEAIAQMLGMQKRKFLKIFDVFFEKNFEIFFTDGERVYQKRIVEEWGQSSEKSRKATASARARWKKQNECERNANAMRTQCERNAIHSYSYSYSNNKDIKHMCVLGQNEPSYPDQIPESCPEENTQDLVSPPDDTESPPKKPKAASGYSEDFEAFWKVYPNSKNKKGAYAKYQAALKGAGRIHKATPEQLLRAAKRYASEVQGKDPQFVLHGSTFLGPQERWAEFDKPLTTMGGEELQEGVSVEDFKKGGGPVIDLKSFERARRGLDPYTPKPDRETIGSAKVG